MNTGVLPWGLKPRPGPLPRPQPPSGPEDLGLDQGPQEPPNLRREPQMGLKAFGKSLVLPLPLQLLRGLRAGSWTPDSSLPLCSIPPSWPHSLLEARAPALLWAHPDSQVQFPRPHPDRPFSGGAAKSSSCLPILPGGLSGGCLLSLSLGMDPSHPSRADSNPHPTPALRPLALSPAAHRAH